MGQVGIEPFYYWLDVVSIFTIGSACVAMSAAIFYLVYAVANLPFRFVYITFAVFILIVGAVQFLDVFVDHQDVSEIVIFLRFAGALVGAVSALMLLLLVPKIIALAMGARDASEHSMKLEAAYEELVESMKNRVES